MAPAMNPKFAHLYDKDILSDITIGMVLHLDPDILEKEGGTFSCPLLFEFKAIIFLSVLPIFAVLLAGSPFSQTLASVG